MLSIFFNDILDNEIILNHLKINDVNFIIGVETDKIISYYYRTNRKVKRPNMLVSLINSFSISLEKDINDQLDYLISNAIYKARTFGIVSNVNEGKIIYNTIHKDCKEIYFYTSSLKHMEMNKVNYLKFKPIRVLYTNTNNIWITNPYNIDIFTEGDYVIFEIDVVMLVKQYYYWALDMLSIGEDIDIAEFVFRVPLSLLTSNYVDFCCFNRVTDLWFNNNPGYLLKNPNPKFTIIPEKRFDSLYKVYINNRLKKYRRIYYTDLLRNIALPYTNALSLLKFNDALLNKQSKWVLVLSRYPIIFKLLDMLPESKHMNKKLISELRINSKYMLSEKIYQSVNDEELSELCYKYLERGKSLKG